MPESVKDQLAADLQKVKSVGGERIDRIRKIFQEALTQTVSELKEGGTAVQSIAKDSSLAELLKKPAAGEAVPEVTPVAVTIEDTDAVDATINQASFDSDITDETVAEAVEATLASSQELTPSAKPQIAIVDRPVSSATPLVNPTTNTLDPDLLGAEPNTTVETETASTEQPSSASLPEPMQAILERITAFWNDQQTQAQVKPVLTRLNQLVALADRKLANRYGERYESFKQEFREDMAETKVWYNTVKTKAVETGEFWIDRKQADFEVKAGEAGATIAQKEQKIKQLLKELWQTVTKG